MISRSKVKVQHHVHQMGGAAINAARRQLPPVPASHLLFFCKTAIAFPVHPGFSFCSLLLS